MWKLNSVNWKNKFPILLAVIMLMVAACSSSETAVPTLTLIPPTPTYTSVPPTITVTRPAPLLPSDLATSVPESLMTLESGDERRIASLALADLPGGATLSLLQAVDWREEEDSCDRFAPLIVPGYRLVFLADNLVYEYHTDDNGAEVRRCSATDIRDVHGETLLLVDPIAAELANLARQRLVDQFDLPLRRIQLVDVEFVTWPDISLGCPEPDQAYTEVDVDGYRIIFSVADEEYIFHTDFDRFIQCDAEDVVLPGE